MQFQLDTMLLLHLDTILFPFFLTFYLNFRYYSHILFLNFHFLFVLG